MYSSPKKILALYQKAQTVKAANATNEGTNTNSNISKTASQTENDKNLKYISMGISGLIVILFIVVLFSKK